LEALERLNTIGIIIIWLPQYCMQSTSYVLYY
jgi:hypothetical protein